MLPVERGSFHDRFPYVRVGTGSTPLVVVPGVGDAMYTGTHPPGLEWGLWWYFARFVDDHSVYVVSRQRHLPDGYAIADMADDYAAVVGAELGASDVLGVSMGGMIGQELAIRRPDLVDRLLLANTGCRIADREAVDRFLSYARERDWAAIRAELAAAMFSDARAASYPPFIRTLARPFLPRPADPADVRVSLEAIRAFDSSDRLDDVAPPTLVFGGTEDPYFPEPILRETAARIPDASLELVTGGKHAAFHERKPRFDDVADAFLRERERVTI